jgi:hypothetical protein
MIPAFCLSEFLVTPVAHVTSSHLSHCSEIAVCTATWQAAAVVEGAENDGGIFLFAFDLSAVDDLTERLANVNGDGSFDVGDFPALFVAPWRSTREEHAEIVKQLRYFEEHTKWKPELLYDPHPATLLGWADGWLMKRKHLA